MLCTLCVAAEATCSRRSSSFFPFSAPRSTRARFTSCSFPARLNCIALAKSALRGSVLPTTLCHCECCRNNKKKNRRTRRCTHVSDLPCLPAYRQRLLLGHDPPSRSCARHTPRRAGRPPWRSARAASTRRVRRVHVPHMLLRVCRRAQGSRFGRAAVALRGACAATALAAAHLLRPLVWRLPLACARAASDYHLRVARALRIMRGARRAHTRRCALTARALPSRRHHAREQRDHRSPPRAWRWCVL